MSDLLPVGTIVKVTEPDRRYVPWGETREVTEPGRTYVGKVVGYDMYGSKYQIGRQYGGRGEGLYLDGGSWAFPSWCTPYEGSEAA